MAKVKFTRVDGQAVYIETPLGSVQRSPDGGQPPLPTLIVDAQGQRHLVRESVDDVIKMEEAAHGNRGS